MINLLSLMCFNHIYFYYSKLGEPVCMVVSAATPPWRGLGPDPSPWRWALVHEAVLLLQPHPLLIQGLSWREADLGPNISIYKKQVLYCMQLLHCALLQHVCNVEQEFPMQHFFSKRNVPRILQYSAYFALGNYAWCAFIRNISRNLFGNTHNKSRKGHRELRCVSEYLIAHPKAERKAILYATFYNFIAHIPKQIIRINTRHAEFRTIKFHPNILFDSY